MALGGTGAHLAHRLGAALGDSRRILSPREASHVRANLRYLGLDRGRGADGLEELVRETFRSFGLFAAEFFLSLRKQPHEMTRGWELKGCEHLHALRSSRQGWILAGAHIGNWEQLRALEAIRGRRIVAPTGTQFHPLVSRLVKRAKRRYGIESVPARGDMRGLVRALRQGALVALPIDGGAFRRGHAVRLCGRRIRLAGGASRLSLLSGRPIVPIFSRRIGYSRQAVEVCPPLLPPHVNGPREARSAARALTQRLADLLQIRLRACPGGWCIFRPIVPETVSGVGTEPTDLVDLVAL